jgi:hypothetical protein
MREIKFRGKDISGRWHYGNLCILTQDIPSARTGHYISNRMGMPFAYSVRPETVGRYIERVDRNGEHIYEGMEVKGDLFDCRLQIRGEVVYDETFSCYGLRNLAGITPLFKINNISIVGNFYENPELPEEK